MQIMPSGGAWTNPAALTQQALSDSKHSGTTKNAAVATDHATPLEQVGKTTDRDAQERYEGPQHRSAFQPAQEGDHADHESMLELPADDDLEAGTLDLFG